MCRAGCTAAGRFCAPGWSSSLQGSGAAFLLHLQLCIDCMCLHATRKCKINAIAALLCTPSLPADAPGLLGRTSYSRYMHC